MAHQFVFLCPTCSAEDSFTHQQCTVCGEQFRFNYPDIQFDRHRFTCSGYLQWLKKNLKVERKDQKPELSAEDLKDVLRYSGPAILRQGLEEIHFQSYGQLFNRKLRQPVSIDKGRLIIASDRFWFAGQKRKILCEISQLTCITTNSHFFEFKIRKQSYFQFEFENESPLKYEILFKKLLDARYAQEGINILEYQPSVRTVSPGRSHISLAPARRSRIKDHILRQFFEFIVLLKLRIFFSFFIKLDVLGRAHLEKMSPFIAVVNHQSILDPFIILAFLDKRIGFLTKSTSFSGTLERIFLKFGRAIPTTRYQTDPAVIFHIRKFLSHGIPVGIFPEGERCWDGNLQPFKLSVIRLLRQMRIPIIPIVVRNSFKMMPRWKKFPRRCNIQIEVLPAFSLLAEGSSCAEQKDWLEALFQQHDYQNSNKL